MNNQNQARLPVGQSLGGQYPGASQFGSNNGPLSGYQPSNQLAQSQSPQTNKQYFQSQVYPQNLQQSQRSISAGASLAQNNKPGASLTQVNLQKPSITQANPVAAAPGGQHKKHEHGVHYEMIYDPDKQQNENQRHREPSSHSHGGGHGGHGGGHGGHGGHGGGHGEHEEEYEALKIPPDLKLAQLHQKAHIVGPVKKGSTQFCPCCTYKIDREPLDLTSDRRELKFLGSGFPLFYNYILWCVYILTTMFVVSGGYNLYANLSGTFCNAPVIDLYKIETGSFTKSAAKKEMRICHASFFNRMSMANRLGDNESFEIQHYLNLILCIIVMVELMFFRRQQRLINSEIDEEQLTPADYTIIVKNIPRNLNTDYKEEIKHIFTEMAVTGSPVHVEKVVLVYDIEYLTELENKLTEAVKRKQQFLKKYGFRKQDPTLRDLDQEIEHIEERINKLIEEIPKDPQYFAGIAFVSFKTEKDKRLVLDENPHTDWERFKCFINNGVLENCSESDLTWDGHKLFLEEAPEPNDIDWEFIHTSTKEKIVARIKSYLLSALFIFLCFYSIKTITEYQEEMNDKAFEGAVEHKIDEFTLFKSSLLSFSISLSVVLFNKFVLGKVYHIIVDTELISTKSRFNVSFAQKLAFALFMNTAMISLLCDILISKNYYGPGGFIESESWMFVWNAIIPPLVWFVDPWTIKKDAERKEALELLAQRDARGDPKCYMTQKELHEVMEQVEYTQGKRYADIMKTMWFTFFYTSCIPVGTLLSIVSLTLYYWVDKRNVIKKRTIKESLSMAVTVEMIEMLELSIVYFALGNILFAYQLNNTVSYVSIAQLVLGVIYMFLPLQEINEWIFEIKNDDENASYETARFVFQTDYDRQNPVIGKVAREEFKNEYFMRHRHEFYEYGQKTPLEQHQGQFMHFITDKIEEYNHNNNIIAPKVALH